jgi:N-acetylmuramoyl-L-alanine amidase
MGWGTGVRAALVLLVTSAVLCAEHVRAQPRQSAAATVLGIRHFSSPAHTRLVIDLSAPVSPRISTIPAREVGPPQRIYVDLPGARVAAGVSPALALGPGPLEAVRVGRGEGGAVRLAIVVRDAAGYEASRLGGPARIVLDVRAGASSVAQAARRAGPSVTPPPQMPAQAPKRPAALAGRPGPVLRRPRGEPPRAPALPPPLKIVLDAGHGGKDPGARGVGGLLEKDVVLAITRRLAVRLEAELGAAVVLTRDRDVSLSLEARTARANAEEADLFVSIHANASARESLSGVETYYLNNTGDRATMRLAAMENGLKHIGNGHRSGTGAAQPSSDLSYILSDLVQQGKLEDSIALSRTLQEGLVGRLREVRPEIVDLGVKQGPFYVLVGAHMPCVLVEVSFLTHPEEGRRLATPAYQEAIADGLFGGLRNYVASLRRAHTL